MNLLGLFRTLLSGRKQYATAASLILLGVGVLTGNVDPASVKVDVTPVTFENVDKKLAEVVEGKIPADSTPSALIGLVTLLLGLDSAANRAAIAKSTKSDKPTA